MNYPAPFLADHLDQQVDGKTNDVVIASTPEPDFGFPLDPALVEPSPKNPAHTPAFVMNQASYAALNRQATTVRALPSSVVYEIDETTWLKRISHQLPYYTATGPPVSLRVKNGNQWHNETIDQGQIKAIGIGHRVFPCPIPGCPANYRSRRVQVEHLEKKHHDEVERTGRTDHEAAAMIYASFAATQVHTNPPPPQDEDTEENIESEVPPETEMHRLQRLLTQEQIQSQLFNHIGLSAVDLHRYIELCRELARLNELPATSTPYPLCKVDAATGLYKPIEAIPWL